MCKFHRENIGSTVHCSVNSVQYCNEQLQERPISIVCNVAVAISDPEQTCHV